MAYHKTTKNGHTAPKSPAGGSGSGAKAKAGAPARAGYQSSAGKMKAKSK
jgi:hypothetical protein